MGLRELTFLVLLIVVVVYEAVVLVVVLLFWLHHCWSRCAKLPQLHIGRLPHTRKCRTNFNASSPTPSPQLSQTQLSQTQQSQSTWIFSWPLYISLCKQTNRSSKFIVAGWWLSRKCRPNVIVCSSHNPLNQINHCVVAPSRSTLLPSSAPSLILWPQPYKNGHLGFNHHHHPQTGITMATPATRWCHIWQWPNWLKSTIAREKNWPFLQIWRSTLRTLPCLGADVTVEWRMVVFTIEHSGTVYQSSTSWPVASKKWRSGVEFAQVFVGLLLLQPS